MIGAIAGDIIGSVHEFLGGKTKDFPLFVEHSRFTDDTVLSVAVADSLMTGTPYVHNFRSYAKKYPDRCYGISFWRWVESGSCEPYNSWGNGSAMRVSAVAFAFDTLEGVLSAARASAEATHNHPEGVRGAQAAAVATFLARTCATKEQIRKEIQTRFGYELSETVEMIRPTYTFNESCQKTVPEAITAALDADGYEEAVRLAISLGGDADTLACISGGIAGAMYGVPNDIAERALLMLDDDLRYTVTRFCEAHDVVLP
jgi:ADP-ribosylglycohydrolase